MLDKEILDGFKEEAKGLLTELTEVVEKLEVPHKTFPAQLLEEYSQKIDRIMGAAKTLLMMAPELTSLKQVGAIAELCKTLGYKAAESKKAHLIPYFAAFWADVLETIEEMVDHVEDPNYSKGVATRFAGPLQKRLEWLKSKVIPPSPQNAESPTSEKQTFDQMDIDALLNSV